MGMLNLLGFHIKEMSVLNEKQIRSNLNLDELLISSQRRQITDIGCFIAIHQIMLRCLKSLIQ